MRRLGRARANSCPNAIHGCKFWRGNRDRRNNPCRHFGADEWSPELADKHLRDIDSICDRLLDQPDLGRTRDDLLPGMRSFLARPHVVFYKQSAQEIHLVRVMHQRHDVDAAFARLKP
jgi:toxin ParE1/3/4